MDELLFLKKYWDDRYAELDLPVYTLVTFQEFDNFIKGNPHKIAPLIFDQVKLAINEDLIQVPIFKVFFQATALILTVCIERNYFDESLEYTIEYFKGTEDYERCSEALKLIRDERNEIHA